MTKIDKPASAVVISFRCKGLSSNPVRFSWSSIPTKLTGPTRQANRKEGQTHQLCSPSRTPAHPVPSSLRFSVQKNLNKQPLLPFISNLTCGTPTSQSIRFPEIGPAGTLPELTPRAVACEGRGSAPPNAPSAQNAASGQKGLRPKMRVPRKRIASYISNFCSRSELFVGPPTLGAEGAFCCVPAALKEAPLP